jgi:hypothetical protein
MKIHKIRVQLYGDGKYYVEAQKHKKSFFRKEKWECIVFYAGTNKPFGYKNFDSALNYFISDFRAEIIESSQMQF